MIEQDETPRDLALLAVPPVGSVQAVGDVWVAYRLCDGSGVVVGPFAAYLRELKACGRPATTQRSYAH